MHLFKELAHFGYFDFFNLSFISCVTVEQTILKLFLLVFEDLWGDYTLYIINVVVIIQVIKYN